MTCLITLPVTAEVLTYVDAQGNRTYTDQPGSGNAVTATRCYSTANPPQRPV